MKKALTVISIILAIICFVGSAGPYISEFFHILLSFLTGYYVGNIFISLLYNLPPMILYSLFPLGLMGVAILTIKFKELTIASLIMSLVYSLFLFKNVYIWTYEFMFYSYGFPFWYYISIIFIFGFRHLYSLVIVLFSLISLILFIIIKVKEQSKKKNIGKEAPLKTSKAI